MASTQIRVPPAFDRAVNRFQQSLTDDEKKRFSHLTSEKDVWDLVEELQNEQASRESLQNMNRIQPFIVGMAQYAQVIEVFIQVKPDIMALIWGPLKLLLQLASKFTESFEKILDAIGRIGENLPRFRRFAAVFSYSDQMQEVISTIYEDIMEFYRRTLKFFRRRAWKIVFSLTWTTFESRFGLILSNLQRHQGLVDNEARAEDIVQSHKAREEELKRVEERQKDEMNRKMKEIMDWLKPVNTEEDKDKAERLKRPGTGNWLLETAGVKDWINGRGKQLVWLTGKPGSGKTILAYTILEHLELRKTSQVLSRLVLYFFCSYSQAASNTCLAILRTLVYQIVSQKKDLLAYAYEELMKPLSISMLRQLFYKLLEASVSPSEQVYIIIDGLDELPDSEREIILPILKELRRQKPLNTVSRTLVASRDLRDIRIGFDKPKAMEVSIEGKNTDDILQYIEHESQRVVEELGLDSQMEKLISDSLRAHADGMFLWVHLVIENLLSQCTPGEVRRALGDLPIGLSQAYGRIMLRIETLNTNQQAKARKILEWMTCASRTLKIGELEDAVSINLGESTIDEENRLLRDCLRYLCGPIVEFSKGTITFVHFTAKEYLLSSYSGPFVNRLTAHLNISLVCTTYQCFNCFESALSSDEAARFVLNGDLRLFDYVQSNWLEHVKEFCKLSPDQSQIRRLSIVLRELFRGRGSRVTSLNFPSKTNELNLQGPLLINTKSFGYFKPDLRVGLMKVEEYHENLTQKIAILSSDEITHWCNENNPLTVDQAGRKLQYALEGLLSEQPPDAARIEKLKTLYGAGLYICRYLFCRMSSGEGFTTQAERKIHEDKHTKPYRCQYQGCVYGSRDFTSSSLLQKHTKDYHNLTIDKTSAVGVEILVDDKMDVGQDSLVGRESSSVDQAYLGNINHPEDLNTDKIDWVLSSMEPHSLLDPDLQAPTIMETTQEIIDSCIHDYRKPTEDSYIENIETSHIEMVLRQLSGQLKSWKDLVQAFYFVSQDIPATQELIFNILRCKEQYSDNFETPNRRYTMSVLMLEQTRARLTKCFAYIKNATDVQDQVIVQPSVNRLQYKATHINGAAVKVSTESIDSAGILELSKGPGTPYEITDDKASKESIEPMGHINKDLLIPVVRDKAVVAIHEAAAHVSVALELEGPINKAQNTLPPTLSLPPIKSSEGQIQEGEVAALQQAKRLLADNNISSSTLGPRQLQTFQNQSSTTQLELISRYKGTGELGAGGGAAWGSIVAKLENEGYLLILNRITELSSKQAQDFKGVDLDTQWELIKIYQRISPYQWLGGRWGQAQKKLEARKFLTINGINSDELGAQQLQIFIDRDLQYWFDIIGYYRQISSNSKLCTSERWEQAQTKYNRTPKLRLLLSFQELEDFQRQDLNTKIDLFILHRRLSFVQEKPIEQTWREAQNALLAYQFLRTSEIDPEELSDIELEKFVGKDLDKQKELISLYHKTDLGLSVGERWRQVQAQEFLREHGISPQNLTPEQFQAFKDQDQDTWQDSIDLYHNVKGTEPISSRWEKVQKELKTRQFLLSNPVDPKRLTPCQFRYFEKQDPITQRDLLATYHKSFAFFHDRRWEQARNGFKAYQFLRLNSINPEELADRQFQFFLERDLKNQEPLVILYQKTLASMSTGERWAEANKLLPVWNLLQANGIDIGDLYGDQLRIFANKDSNAKGKFLSYYRATSNNESTRVRWEAAEKEYHTREFLRENSVDPNDLTTSQFQTFKDQDLGTQKDYINVYHRASGYSSFPTSESWEKAHQFLPAYQFLQQKGIDSEELPFSLVVTFALKPASVQLDLVLLYNQINPGNFSIEKRWRLAQELLSAKDSLRAYDVDPENLTLRQLQTFEDQDTRTRQSWVDLYRTQTNNDKKPSEEKWEHIQAILEATGELKVKRADPERPTLQEFQPLQSNNLGTQEKSISPYHDGLQRGVAGAQKKQEKEQAQQRADPGPVDEMMQDVPENNDSTDRLYDLDSVPKEGGSQSVVSNRGGGLDIFSQERGKQWIFQVVLAETKNQPLRLELGLTPTERASFILELVSALTLALPGVDIEGVIRIAKSFERTTLFIVRDKTDYRVQARKRLLLIRSRQMAAEEIKMRSANIPPPLPLPSELPSITPPQQPQQPQTRSPAPTKQQSSPPRSNAFNIPFTRESMRVQNHSVIFNTDDAPSAGAPDILDSQGSKPTGDAMDIFEPGTLRSTRDSNQPSLFGMSKSDDNGKTDDHMDISKPENPLKESSNETTLSEAERRFLFEGGSTP